MQARDASSRAGQSAHRLSLPSHLLWRSVLGTPASHGGSSLRGSYLVDTPGGGDTSQEGMLRCIPADGRMRRLPISIRDMLTCGLDLPRASVSADDAAAASYDPRRRRRRAAAAGHSAPSAGMLLLPHPKIVGSATQPSPHFSSSRTAGGVSCMDLDGGNDGTLGGSPSRYLLVGSGGGDCSISLYDLSYFGSDGHSYPSRGDGESRRRRSERAATHRPIARSIRHAANPANASGGGGGEVPAEAVGGVPSGHRQPLLGVHWYPGDVRGMFVSASVSGEVLVWDATSFTPAFATYCHVYAGRGRMGGEGPSDNGRSVAPLRCTDLPRTPEGCVHGTALLALGLGPGQGRGVVRLCDAFRGGGVTHELIGHGADGSGGGVNCVAWDPGHPFRLVSGGDDRTVRVWDVRKAGEAACLGVLDKERDISYSSSESEPAAKRQRVGLPHSSAARSRGVESHGSAVAALAFAPGGDDLASVGADGRIHHWDLRADSCFASSAAAARPGSCHAARRMTINGGMDPSVAFSGRLVPTHFSLHGGRRSAASSFGASHMRRPCLAIVQPGSRSTATLIASMTKANRSEQYRLTGRVGRKDQIAGYSLFGRRGKEPGGAPDFTLGGHLDSVTCLTPIQGTWDNLQVGNDKNSSGDVRFLTGGRDGMVLAWGVDCGKRSGGDSYEWGLNGRGGGVTLEEPYAESLEDVDSW